MKSIVSAICSALVRARALVEQRRRQHREAVLAFRIVRGAGADDHAHADRPAARSG